MTNNLIVKFWKRAFKIKMVVAIITLKEQKKFLCLTYHREHTILLNRKKVNKGMKRANSLPLSPVVHSYATSQS